MNMESKKKKKECGSLLLFFGYFGRYFKLVYFYTSNMKSIFKKKMKQLYQLSTIA